MLAAAPPQARIAVVAAVVAACVGFDIAQVFTGSLLRRVAGEWDADRLSALGFAAGYAGGAIALVIATAVVTAHARLGLDMAGGLRVAFAVTAAWWLVFSVPVGQYPRVPCIAWLWTHTATGQAIYEQPSQLHPSGRV